MRTARLIGHVVRTAAGAVVGGALAALLAVALPGSVLQRASTTVASGALHGSARVKDGDTIVIVGTTVRLEGIDAPESAQSCRTADGGPWPCGHEATRALADLIGADDVACEHRGLDKYGRMLGVCFAGGRDLNAEMVRRGWAWAFVRYSQTYRGLEAAARVARVGIWQGDAQPPWDFRASRAAPPTQPLALTQPLHAGPAAVNGCTIKGNVTAGGLIYHTPSSPWYQKVSMGGATGKRWFCSESEAVAAGWRAAIVR